MSNKIRLWNKNFFLIWQGQLVSSIGNYIYIIALDLWILDSTNSILLMGLLNAIAVFPNIICQPFAGVFIDRWDRKKVIVISDFIRGIIITYVGIAALMGFVQVWMIFAASIINAICDSFFEPAIMSVTPDIVHESKLLKANALFTLATSSADMIGNAMGGILYFIIGAPYMFLFNGLSYLFSGVSELFISIPKVEKKHTKITFIEDFKIGFSFLKEFKELKNMFLILCFNNFFINTGFVLIVAYFKEVDFLGAEKYGFAMTMLALGVSCGSLLLSSMNIKKKQELPIVTFSLLTSGLLLVASIIVNNYYILLMFIFFAFMLREIPTTIITSNMMTMIPVDIRGKVMALLGTLKTALVPIGCLLGGLLGDIFNCRQVIFYAFLCYFILSVICILSKILKNFIEYNTGDSDIDAETAT